VTIRLIIVDRDGSEREVGVPALGTLMEALRDLDCGIAAVCGGTCACATCHVYVAPGWEGKLPAQSSDERDLIRELQHRSDTSRLSCQVPLCAGLDGLRLTVAPEE
jgi:ferredoxin, 2Fe-2S